MKIPKSKAGLIPVDTSVCVDGKWTYVKVWKTPEEVASLAEQLESEERLVYNVNNKPDPKD